MVPKVFGEINIRFQFVPLRASSESGVRSHSGHLVCFRGGGQLRAWSWLSAGLRACRRHNGRSKVASPLSHLAEAVMSNLGLPTELLDKIFDLLHDDTDTLKRCCLVSKSWIPPTRKRLFAEVEFFSPKIRQAWKNTFPDPSTSPACYTKSLQVHVNSKGIPLADAYREKRDRPFTFRDLPLLARRFYFRFSKVTSPKPRHNV